MAANYPGLPQGLALWRGFGDATPTSVRAAAFNCIRLSNLEP
jgi:hypothetical protein